MHGLAPIFIALALSLALTGCGESKFAKLSDQELSEKMRRCRANTNPSPGAAVACGNYEKECQRRREEGKMVCY